MSVDNSVQASFEAQKALEISQDAIKYTQELKMELSDIKNVAYESLTKIDKHESTCEVIARQTQLMLVELRQEVKDFKKLCTSFFLGAFMVTMTAGSGLIVWLIQGSP